MKTFLNTFIAVGILAGSMAAVTSAQAFDAKTFWEGLEKSQR